MLVVVGCLIIGGRDKKLSLGKRDTPPPRDMNPGKSCVTAMPQLHYGSFWVFLPPGGRNEQKWIENGV